MIGYWKGGTASSVPVDHKLGKRRMDQGTRAAGTPAFTLSFLIPYHWMFIALSVIDYQLSIIQLHSYSLFIEYEF